MAQFQYRATDAEGKILEGVIDAAERSIAVARLQDRGLIPLKVAEPTAQKSGLASISLPSFSFKRGVRQRDLLIFTHEMSTLLALTDGVDALPREAALVSLARLGVLKADSPRAKAATGATRRRSSRSARPTTTRTSTPP